MADTTITGILIDAALALFFVAGLAGAALGLILLLSPQGFARLNAAMSRRFSARLRSSRACCSLSVISGRVPINPSCCQYFTSSVPVFGRSSVVRHQKRQNKQHDNEKKADNKQSFFVLAWNTWFVACLLAFCWTMLTHQQNALCSLPIFI
jgi:hypothetical protein